MSRNYICVNKVITEYGEKLVSVGEVIASVKASPNETVEFRRSGGVEIIKLPLSVFMFCFERKGENK